MRNYSGPQTILSAKAANGVGNSFFVLDYRHIVLQIATTGSATLTVKIQGSISETMPDFSAAASSTNQWTYLDSVDYISNSVIAGGTGYAASGTDIVKNCEVNVNGMRWINVEVSGRSAGSVTVIAIGFNDN